MNIEIKNNISPELKLNISPKLQQSLKILQMNCIMLNSYIDQQCIQNPLLELQPEAGCPDSLDLLLKDNNTDSLESSPFKKQKSMPFCPPPQPNKDDFIINQLHMLPLNRCDLKAAEYLVFSLDENGYFKDNLIKTANQLQITTNRVKKLLSIIQTLEPYGIGARNLNECLKIQIKQKGLSNDNINVILDKYFKELCNNKLKVIADCMKIPLSEVKKCYRVIKTLNPKPAASLRSTKHTKYIIPDITVTYNNGTINVSLNDSFYPVINLNKKYTDMLSQSLDPKTKEYIVNHMKKAMHLKKCVYKRSETLEKVSSCILKLQHDFFKSGPSHLIPMNLEDIAKRIQVHISTVSRAIDNKYLQCDYGTFYLKNLFTNKITTGNKNDISPNSVKDAINEIINSEDKSNPLSDSKITEILSKRNINISRRTVAKYRKELDIPASNLRKNY